MSVKIPRVSVVVPIFNVERYLKEAIDSILIQSFSDLEVICVNDGSTDRSAEILKMYQDPRLIVVNQKNQGLSAARNTGIYHARGEFIALLDSDDFWSEDKLAVHVDHLEKNKDVGISYCPSLFVDEQSKLTGLGQFPQLKDIHLKQVMCRNPVGNGSAAVIRKHVFDDLRSGCPRHSSGRYCFFDEAMRQSEDIDFWIKVSLETRWKFAGVSQPLTYYRVNAISLSANHKKQYAAWCFAMNKHLKTHKHEVQPLFKLAEAYQLRYLSRRASQARDSRSALRYMWQALLSNPRIITEEPVKSVISIIAAFLCGLPDKLYNFVEKFALRLLKDKNINLESVPLEKSHQK